MGREMGLGGNGLGREMGWEGDGLGVGRWSWAREMGWGWRRVRGRRLVRGGRWNWSGPFCRPGALH